ncbi:olfactory receptor 5P64-like [Ranitomeya variabilis]|uniref:olfactory receptor 5P64-like n=1 Tax=Ranitomeya variabilis TaxID=490064 RepID=UPI0040559F01
MSQEAGKLLHLGQHPRLITSVDERPLQESILGITEKRTKPLTDLTQKGYNPKEWSPEAESSFLSLKQAFSTVPAIHRPMVNKQFFMEEKIIIGYILMYKLCVRRIRHVTQIRLFGFQNLSKYKPLIFLLLTRSYICILGGNLLIILLVTIIHQLKTPMFFFLKHLSIADALLTTSVIPMMLGIMFVEEGVLSLWGCLTQLYFCGIFGFVQCFLIVIMSYDRYLAICHLLRYSSLISPDLCLRLVIGAWFLDIVLISSEFLVFIQSNFCGLNYIDHFFCDLGPLMELATSDISIVMLQDFVYCIFMIFFPFVFIIDTYFCIFFTILNISYDIRKAFSTCSSHLTRVCAYYGTLIVVYMAPSDERSSNINKCRSLLYLVVTPLLNPIIYSLRNNYIRRFQCLIRKLPLRPDPRLCKPTRYSSDPKLCRGFLNQCQLHFRLLPQQYPKDVAELAFLASHLEGEALAWFNPLLKRNDPIVSHLQDFLDAFRKIFDEPG